LRHRKLAKVLKTNDFDRIMDCIIASGIEGERPLIEAIKYALTLN